MDTHIQTVFMAIAGMIGLLSLILGLDKMIRIIMGNYLISSILLGLSNLIELISGRLLVWAGPERWIDALEHRVARILMAGKPTFLLTVYFILLVFITTKSDIGIGQIKNEGLRWALMIVFLPCTIISIMLTVALALFGNQMINIDELKILATPFVDQSWVYNFIMLTPLRIVLPGLVTFLIAALFLRSKQDFIQTLWGWGGDEEHKD